ncbi:MAG: ATP-binding protein, partial [Phycisphaerales bacterium]
FVASARRVIETGRPHEEEARSVTGAWLMVRIMPYVTHTGRTGGVVATFIDITAIKNANEMTRVANNQLGHANAELKTQREELEEMFSIVAHDLKRPVIALDGLLSIIRDDASADPAAAGASPPAPENGTGAGAGASGPGLLERAQGECARMRQMLMDLESVSDIQSRSVSTMDVDIQDWLDGLVARYGSEATARRVRINCTCDHATLALPRSFLEEMFTNLFENALKYGCTSPSPRIDVSGRVVGEVFELSVADNGKGIAKEHHLKIFEPFRRLDPAAAPGSGIGLLAVKRLAHRLGGRADVESAPGKGAKFTVRVPIASEGEPGRSITGRTRVLLVEDDLIDARSIERHLGAAYNITRAQDLKEAGSRLREDRFDVVLLDLSLPDGHGLELIQTMTSELKMQIPTVVITGHGEGLDTAKSDAVIGAYLAKDNISQTSLVSAIHQALKDEAAAMLPTG